MLTYVLCTSSSLFISTFVCFIHYRRFQHSARPASFMCGCGHHKSLHSRTGCHHNPKGYSYTECRCVEYLSATAYEMPELPD